MIGDIRGYLLLKNTDNVMIGFPNRMPWERIVYTSIQERLASNAPLPIIDIGNDNNSYLVMATADKGAALCDIRDAKNSVQSMFLCEEYMNVVCPPGLNDVHKAAYAIARLNRKGGYGDIVKKMVIMTSLMKGKVTDDFLFAVEKDEAIDLVYALRGLANFLQQIIKR